jgi:hypothetical protein
LKEKEIFAADISRRYGKKEQGFMITYPNSRLAVVDLFVQ